ncbi:MAG: Gfo/Idh/MocA family oxidoreductase [Anaerolineales bacterium]|nr:Gfo/Idh/MocA family oxidoreductase [Anaerolineales bacterium]
MKVAVIGVGSMGKNHARVYSELPDVELAAVVDEDLSIAEDLSNKFGTRAYTDYRKMLEIEKPEVVSIVVPTALHEKVGMQILEAGVHVLMEKPIAAALEEGQRLIEKARTVKRKLMVGHIVRFNPAIQALKQKLVNGDLGRIYQVFCRRAGPFPARIRDVGVVIDLAPHDVDVMRFLTGSDPIRVFAETEQRIHTNHEDLLWGMLRFPDGVVGSLEINWLTPTKVREVLVLGERGLFRVDDLTQDLYFYENAQAKDHSWSALATLKGVSEGSMTRFALQRYEPLKAELQAFIKAVQDDLPVPVSGEDGLAALKLSLALVESGKSNQVISV